MNDINVSTHAVDKYMAHVEQFKLKGVSRENAAQKIVTMWEQGTKIEFDKSLKIYKYGVKDLAETEHRQYERWRLTMTNNTIVTVHWRSKTETRRAARARKKLRKRGKKRGKRVKRVKSYT